MELKIFFFLVNVTVTAYSHKCHPQFLFYSPCIMFIMHFTYVISTMHCNYFYFRQFSFSAVTNRNEWDFISSSLMSSPPHPFYFSAVLVSTQWVWYKTFSSFKIFNISQSKGRLTVSSLSFFDKVCFISFFFKTFSLEYGILN